MIKISKINNRNKDEFLENILEEYIEQLKKIDRERYKKLLEYLEDNGEISNKKVKKILVGDINVLREVIECVGEMKEENEDAFHKLYTKFSNRKFGYSWAEKIGVKVCPYCNRSYIITLKGKSRPQYDHFFSKNLYPYLAVSMYNLIPCCSICNLSKGSVDTNEKKIIYPYEDEFGYDVCFKIDTNDIYSYLGMSDDFSLKIKSNDNVNGDMQEKVKNSNEIFNLEKFYNKHKEYSMMILKNKYIYTDEYCQSILDNHPSLFSNIDEVKNNLYLNYLEKEDWGEQVLSKLTYDLLHNE